MPLNCWAWKLAMPPVPTMPSLIAAMGPPWMGDDAPRRATERPPGDASRRPLARPAPMVRGLLGYFAFLREAISPPGPWTLSPHGTIFSGALSHGTFGAMNGNAPS